MEVAENRINYKNADNCAACPGRNDEEGCPWWWEWCETNMSNGQERLRKQCGKAAMQVFMVEVIKASNRPAAAVEDTRNEIVKGFERLVGLAQQKNTNKKSLPNKIKRMLKGGQNG